MFDSKANFRKQQYKMAIDTTAARRMRGENMVQIRKSKREESLKKKRRRVVASAPNCDLNEQLQDLSATVFALAYDDIQTKEAAAIHLRNMLSIGGAPPIDMVIQSGVVPLLIDILKRGDMPQLQFEAAWSLTNIVAGTSDHAKVVIDSGAVPIFIKLLSSENDNVREQAVWALGNIAGDSPDYRDLALAYGALRPVIAQFNENASFSMVRNAAWTLSNLCRGKPLPPFDLVKDAFPMLGRLIRMEDEEILTNTCWALSDLTDSPSLKIQEIIDAGIFPKLVELLSHPSWLVVIPILRTVGNIASGDDVQTQFVIDNHVLPPIFHLLTTQQTKKNIIREACWTISNITAGTKEQVQAVINAQIFPPLISLLANAQLDIKREAAWAVSNATSAGSNEQIRYLASEGCIDPLCDLLACQDPRIIKVCLEGLENIMTAGTIERNAGLTDVNIYAQLIQDKVNDMQLHESTEVSENSIDVLDTYFAEEHDDDIPWSDTLQTACGFNADQLPQVPPGGFNFS